MTTFLKLFEKKSIIS